MRLKLLLSCHPESEMRRGECLEDKEGRQSVDLVSAKHSITQVCREQENGSGSYNTHSDCDSRIEQSA